MGKVIKTEQSADNRFQFTLWGNDDGGFIVEITKFFKGKAKGVDFKRFDRLRMTPSEFEKFKVWIKHFKKK